MTPELLDQYRQLLQALVRLEDQGADTPLEAVADVAGLAPPDAATMLDVLEAQGLVFKRPFVSAHRTIGVPSTVSYGITASGRKRLTT